MRFGTKIVVAAGVTMIAAFYAWVGATVSPGLGYGTIAAQMGLFGIGLGFTTAPATESILGAVAAEQSGIGSAVNDAARLLGGTLGVTVIGSIYASLYSGRLSHLPSVLPSSAATAAPLLGGRGASSGSLAGDVLDQFMAATGEPVSSYDGTNGLEPRSDLAGLNLTTASKVMIECANMRNATDASLLTDPDWRQSAATGMEKGLSQFLVGYP